MDNLWTKFQPIEQIRWNQSNVDSMAYAGYQRLNNKYAGLSNYTSFNNYAFNLLCQPINMVTGYQRQHRKSINYIPGEGADTQTTDQYTRIIDHVCNIEGINEQYSRACELAAISGMVLMQPYLDYMGNDPAQGQLKLKIWEYNSYLADPFFRDFYQMSDCSFIWTQEWITKRSALDRFPKQIDKISPMSGSPQRYGRFYFLPEQYSLVRNDLMVLSYIWYKWKTKKKKLYSRSKNQFYDFAGGQEQLDQILYAIQDAEVVEMDVPCWKVAIVLNDQLMFQGENPLGEGMESCPFIPVFWEYEPHIGGTYELRVRSLTRHMLDAQMLMSRRININADISEATINSGWKRKVGAVANEENLKKTGQGWDILINEGYELQDIEKILPSEIPMSDMEFSKQLSDLIFATSGINLENWSAQEDVQASTLTVLLKQAANLMVLQKYFDQWDSSLKVLGERLLQIILYNWNAEKIKTIIGEEPSPFFYSRIFARYQTIVEEGLNTATQRQQEFQQTLELNQILGGIIPPSYIASIATLQGKNKLMEALQQQEQQQQAIQKEATDIQHAFEEAKLHELYSKAANNLAAAKERYGRFESNIGLLEERMSELQKNRALSTKAQAEALEKILEAISKYGEIETNLKMNQIQSYDYSQSASEEKEKQDARRDALQAEFTSKLVNKLMGDRQGNNNPQMGQEMGQLQEMMQ